MSAQPEYLPLPSVGPAPGAPGELLAALRADRRAEAWVPRFERDWAAALEESRRTFTLGLLYDVVREWQGRLAHAPAVDAFLASECDDSVDTVDMAELRGRRR
ncbi:DUF6247 family protein (plasmid) [Streptomyces sp. BI20]|uniref:DUF6247 family protein n=1 Tax=Streptomyces sp. BI20 TaxID=3403460 RepID=UPI003C796C4C